jgi:ubiquinone/menaquinone biosynthesis C-methylase UbiE
MYDEKADFDRHVEEVGECLRVLSLHGYSPIDSHNVLDLGGGVGMHAGLLSDKFGRVTCADILDYTSLYDGQFFKLMSEKHSKNNVPMALQKIAFIQTDAMNLLFRNDLFDACVCINAFEHIPDPGKALVELVRVMKPGAYAYISFDPIWTCDTGSHFFHRVPEPWAHLLVEQDQFEARMAQLGADDEECRQFRGAMNGWREFKFSTAFSLMQSSGAAEILFSDTYSGLSDERHREHPNFAAAKLAGYAEHELLLRRLRWVIRKRS